MELPRSQACLEQEQWLVLLNGLDEVEAEYLKKVGKPVTAVYEVLQSNSPLQQLITTPLMLHVIVLAYLLLSDEWAQEGGWFEIEKGWRLRVKS